MTGKVKWFNDFRGFGFISFSETKQAFVHYSNIDVEGYKSLKEGEQVEFDLYEPDPKRAPGEYEARNVKKIN